MVSHAIDPRNYLADLQSYPQEHWIDCVAVDLRTIALSIFSANHLLHEEMDEPEIRELLHDMIQGAADHLMQYAAALAQYDRLRRHEANALPEERA